jgi:replicative DNA helicase
MLDQAITFAMQGRTILFFTFEMTKEECVERLISRCCSIDNFELMTGRVANDWDTHKDKLNEFYEKLNSLKLIFIESIGKTFDELFCIIETLNTPIDAIFIDYIQLVKSQNTSKNEKQVIDDYINKLYAYTKTKNFLTIVGSQINRSTHNGKQVLPPEIWEIKGSGAVEEISDLIILLHWQWFYTREEEKKYDYWIRVAKNRGGRTGVFNCQYFPHYYQFKEYQQVDKNFLSKPVKKETNDYTNRD